MSQPSKQSMIRKHVSPAPAAANNTGVHAAMALPASGTTTFTTALTNPDVPRTVRLKGNATTTQGVSVIVTGTDVYDKPLTETRVMGGAFATPTDTLNAFKTVTSITVPTQGAGGDTISAGFGAALGLAGYCDAYSFAGFNLEASITSFTYSLTVISLNTVLLSATLDGSTDQCFFYVPDTFITGRQWG